MGLEFGGVRKQRFEAKSRVPNARSKGMKYLDILSESAINCRAIPVLIDFPVWKLLFHAGKSRFTPEMPMNRRIRMQDATLWSGFRTLRAGRGLTVLCLLFCSLMPGLSSSAHAATVITFDPPGSVATFAAGVNSSGAITGSFYDINGVGYGFVRNPNGYFTTFNAPPDGGFGPFPS